MIAVVILLCFLAVLTILLLIPVRLILDYSDGFTMQLRYAFLKFPLIPKDKPAEKKRPPNLSSKKKKEKNNLFEEKVKQEGLLPAVRWAARLAREGLDAIEWLVSHIEVRRFRLHITAASDDAADTAFVYGGICGVVYPFLGWASAKLRFKECHVDILPDFQTGKWQIRGCAQLSLRPVYVLAAVFPLAVRYIGLKNEDNKTTKDGANQ